MKDFMKIASIALVSATMVATPAMAQSNVSVAPVQEASQLVQSINVNTVADIQLSQDIQASDLSYAFADSQNLQMQQMTGQEMVETEGAGWGRNAFKFLMGLAQQTGKSIQGAYTWCMSHKLECAAKTGSTLSDILNIFS